MCEQYVSSLNPGVLLPVLQCELPIRVSEWHKKHWSVQLNRNKSDVCRLEHAVWSSSVLCVFRSKKRSLSHRRPPSLLSPTPLKCSNSPLSSLDGYRSFVIGLNVCCGLSRVYPAALNVKTPPSTIRNPHETWFPPQGLMGCSAPSVSSETSHLLDGLL